LVGELYPRKEVKMPGHKDIRSAPDEERYEIYRQIDQLCQKGKHVVTKEHKSGFPAITIDCEEIHVLTDCLSLETWNAKQKETKEGAG
jgi:hypothetical protein